MAEARPWPEFMGEHGEILELFEETLEATSQTSEELRERARELRQHAAETDVLGHRETALALAERYEQEAAARVAAR